MGLSSLNPTGAGGFIDPKQFVPVTRTINGKPLSADVVLALADFESKPGQSLDQFITALEQKIAELELAIESGTTPSDLKPLKDAIDEVKRVAGEAKNAADANAKALDRANSEIGKLKKASEVEVIPTNLTENWGVYGVNGEGCKICKVGSLVNVSISAMYFGNTGESTFYVLPEGMRPKFERFFWAIKDGSDSRCYVSPDGRVTMIGGVEYRTQILVDFSFVV